MQMSSEDIERKDQQIQIKYNMDEDRLKTWAKGPINRLIDIMNLTEEDANQI